MSRGRAAAALAALLLALLAAAWASGGLGALGRSLAADRAAAAREAVVGEVFAPALAHPGFQARAQGLDAAGVQALIFELAREGLPRLPDETLLERLALLREVAARSDEGSCATVLLGGTADAGQDLVAALDEALLRRWLGLSREAVLASLREDPARPLAAEDAERAREALLAAMPPADAERFLTALQSPASISTREACALARSALGAADGLAPDDRRLVARLFAGG